MTSQVSCQPGVNLSSRVANRGPRSVLIRRESGGFGFTLRHFIVYPPDSIKKQPSENPPSGSYSGDPPWGGAGPAEESMDTIFVREVREGSCAQLAGLVTGDRIITINKQPLTGKSYSQVIDLIQNSGNTLHLLVVPKEDDILQKYFSGSAYQPVDRSLDGPSFSCRDRSSVSSCSGAEPIYARVHKRNLPHHSQALDRSWPLRQPSSFQQSSSSAPYPGNCRSLGSLQPPNSSRPPSFGNARSASESDSHYRSPRASVSLEQRPFYSSHSQDGVCKEPIYATARPYRFQDTFSKLLVDMWYPQGKVMHTPVGKQEHVYRMKEQSKPGLAGLFSKTMKAFLPPHEHHREQWMEPSNGFYAKQSRTEYLDNCRETDILDSDSATDSSDVPGSVCLVAQRKQQFESGSLHDKAQERTNMYRHELSRVSSPNPCPIVQKRAAQFETLASPTRTDCRTQSSHHGKTDNGFHSAIEVPSSVKTEGLPSYHFKPVHPPESSPSGPSNYGVIFRRKQFTDPDKHITRRISYLKATAEERMLVESDLTEDEEKKALAQRAPMTNEGNEQRIETLKPIFGEKTPQSCDSLDVSQAGPEATRGSEEEDDEYDDALTSPGTMAEAPRERLRRDGPPARAAPPMMEGWLSCKLVSVQGKRSPDRSWRTVWALFRGSTLHLLRDKKEPSSSPIEVSQFLYKDSSSEIYDTSINLKTTYASIAHDYTKRKHVLRLKLANGTEYLFQTDSQVSMLDWLYTFKAVGLESEKEYLWHHASVLEKAAAYEQQIGLYSGTTSNNVREGMVSPVQGVKPGSGVKLPFRHRSPTGHSPAVKTRRASHGDELSQGPRLSSVLRNRVGSGWRKAQSMQTEALPKGASVGVRLEDCPPALHHQYVPLLVELCVEVVETHGLELVGIFRVPGNNAAVSLLIESANQGALLPASTAQSPSAAIGCLQDPRWKDVNVVSSLLKAFFRKLPEPLLTTVLYSKFINASKTEDIEKRLRVLRNLLHQLPRHHYETLKFLIQHLKRVVDHSHINKMEARNLAIVFGPTLVRPSDTSMVALVTDMSHQCYIIETFINYGDWLFSEGYMEEVPCDTSPGGRRLSHPLPISRSHLLLKNLQKMEQSPYSPLTSASSSPAKAPSEVVSRELLSSLMFASQRKHSNRRREPSVLPVASSSPSSSSISQCNSDPCSPYKRSPSLSSNISRPPTAPSPLSVSPVERDPGKVLEPRDTGPLGDEVVHHTYDEINSLTQERIRRFERETRALLRREPANPASNQGGATTSSLPAANGKKAEGRIDWQQIEQEWQKAKRELEQDDLLDVVADDPSFLTYLLNRQDHSPPGTTTTSTTGYSSAPASLVLTPQEAQLERLSSSLEGSLQLGQRSSSPSSSTKIHRNSLQATSSPLQKSWDGVESHRNVSSPLQKSWDGVESHRNVSSPLQKSWDSVESHRNVSLPLQKSWDGVESHRNVSSPLQKSWDGVEGHRTVWKTPAPLSSSHISSSEVKPDAASAKPNPTNDFSENYQGSSGTQTSDYSWSYTPFSKS